MIFFTDIPFSLNRDQLFEQFRIRPGTDRAKEFGDLVGKVQEKGRPKVLYKISFIEEKGEDTVTLEGVTFKSPALRKNLDSVERVFPYVATCGIELDEIKIEKGDMLKKLWISFLKGRLLETSLHYLQEHLDKRYRVSQTGFMNPGSGDASVWPIEQQRDLFSILGDVEGRIGVRITESLVLTPDMSVSGIVFPSETNFESCQLCHRERCRFRRAPFDKGLWDSINRE